MDQIIEELKELPKDLILDYLNKLNITYYDDNIDYIKLIPEIILDSENPEDLYELFQQYVDLYYDNLPEEVSTRKEYLSLLDSESYINVRIEFSNSYQVYGNLFYTTEYKFKDTIVKIHDITDKSITIQNLVDINGSVINSYEMKLRVPPYSILYGGSVNANLDANELITLYPLPYYNKYVSNAGPIFIIFDVDEYINSVEISNSVKEELINYNINPKGPSQIISSYII